MIITATGVKKGVKPIVKIQLQDCLVFSSCHREPASAKFNQQFYGRGAALLSISRKQG